MTLHNAGTNCVGTIGETVPGTMTVAELVDKLKTRKGKARILIHINDQKGRIVEGILPDEAPEFGVGDDSLNIVYLYGLLTDEYDEEEWKQHEQRLKRVQHFIATGEGTEECGDLWYRTWSIKPLVADLDAAVDAGDLGAICEARDRLKEATQ